MTEKPMEGINVMDEKEKTYTKSEVQELMEKAVMELLTEVKNMAYGLDDIKYMRIGMDVLIEATEKMIKEFGSKA